MRRTDKARRGMPVVTVVAAIVVAALFAACGGEDGDERGAGAVRGEGDPSQSFWGEGSPVGFRPGAVELEHYNSLEGLALYADVVVRAKTGAVRSGPTTGPADDPLPSTIVELEPIEVLAGPDDGPIELVLPGVGPEEADTLSELPASDAVYFLRSGTLEADVAGAPADAPFRSLFRITNTQGLYVNAGGETRAPGLAKRNAEGGSPDFALELATQSFERTLADIGAALNEREARPDDGEAARRAKVEEFVGGPPTAR